VDHVLIVHAGDNQAASAGGSDDIWSHRWIIPGGEAVDGLRVEHYMLVSEHDAMNVFAHEFGHDLGAPDLYDRDGDSVPVGLWCNMGSNIESDQPPHFCGLLKIDIDADFTNGMVGWSAADSLTVDGNFSITSLHDSSTGSVYITKPAFSGGEHFIV